MEDDKDTIAIRQLVGSRRGKALMTELTDAAARFARAEEALAEACVKAGITPAVAEEYAKRNADGARSAALTIDKPRVSAERV